MYLNRLRCAACVALLASRYCIRLSVSNPSIHNCLPPTSLWTSSYFAQAIFSRLHHLDLHVHSHEASIRALRGALGRLEADVPPADALASQGAELERLQARVKKIETTASSTATAAKVYQVSHDRRHSCHFVPLLRTFKPPDRIINLHLMLRFCRIIG